MKTISRLFVPFALLLLAETLLLLATACSGSSVTIRPGDGFEADLAKALAAGELRTEEEPESTTRTGGESDDERVLQDAEQMPAPNAAPSTPAARGRVPATDPVAAPAEELGELARDGLGVDHRGLGRQAGEPAAVGAEDKSVSGKLDASPQTWQRSNRRPSFARVYVGDGNSLQLQRMRVTVTVEGPRARTVVDHVFRNPHDRQLEGTFEYPLPAGASPCYYAMFLTGSQEAAPDFFPDKRIEALPPGLLAVMEPQEAARLVEEAEWGELREAKVVARDTARQVYEQIVRRDIDPALLEYASGNTFRGRVFPIQPGSYNRVILAYEQHLDAVEGKVAYRFPLPDCDLEVLSVTATLPVADAAADALVPEGAARREVDGRIVHQHAWEADRGPGGELVLSYTPTRPELQVIAGDDPTSDLRSFYLRFSPELPTEVDAPWARQAVFVLDTSLSEDPDRFNANLKVLRSILERDSAIERFNVCCFDVGAHWVNDGWITNDAAGRESSFRKLGDVLLEGATDFGAAVELLREARFGERAPTNVFVLTDGELTWGEQDPQRLAAQLADCASFEPRVFCYRTGLSAENLELFEQITRGGGAIFNVFTEEMAEGAALAHRQPAMVIDSVQLHDAQGRAVRDLLVAGRRAALHPGGELVLAGRHAGIGTATLMVKGRFQGEAKSFELPVDLSGDGDLAARGWAQIAVQQLLARRDPKLEPLATAYAQHFHIAGRTTSFLVLETDQEYEQYGIEETAKELRADDLGAFLDQVYRGDVTPTERKVAFQYLLQERLGGPAAEAENVTALLGMMDEQDFVLPPGVGATVPLAKSAADAGYLKGRQADGAGVDQALAEAQRRLEQDAAFAGLRALSNVPELHPGRSDALRLVGYRLLALAQQGAAAQLFDQVLQQRPFEPHSWRDLARSLQRAGRYPMAALCYEVLLAGKWHERFHQSLLVVAKEEYAELLREGLRAGGLRPEVIDLFGQRVEELTGDEGPADLRVTISWNTDSTDVDLWIVEPSGEACGYSHQETKSGGQLLDDLTQGYGPERYRIVKAPEGSYSVLVHYYSENPNLIAGETHVEVVVTTKAGTSDEQTRRFPVVLQKEKQAYEVCVVEL